MITSTEAERLLVVSDIHLGNRLFRARRPFIEFLRYASDRNADLCINGDGIDISQLSLQQITHDISACSHYLREMTRRNLRVFYVIGNHDIVLENFLDDWGVVCVVPFLNVESHGTRIHIEHAHLFDSAFVQFPRVYTLMTYLGRLCLKIHPRVYRGLEKVKPLGERLRRMIKREVIEEIEGAERIENEPVGFYEAAAEIARHGYDYVLFGHTHHSGVVPLPGGATYINTGSWLFDPYFVEIEQGRVRLRLVAEEVLKPMRESSWFEFSRKQAARV